MQILQSLNGRPMRVWALSAFLAWVVFLVTRFVLLGHSVMFSEQAPGALFGAVLLGMLRDVPVVLMLAWPWALFEIAFNRKWADRLRWPLLAIYAFTLIFVGVSEGVFWEEFSVRFNFIAVDYLVFTTEVIGNIRESYPVGKIISGLAVLTLLVVWSLRRPLRYLSRAVAPSKSVAMRTACTIIGSSGLFGAS